MGIAARFVAGRGAIRLNPARLAEYAGRNADGATTAFAFLEWGTRGRFATGDLSTDLPEPVGAASGFYSRSGRNRCSRMSALSRRQITLSIK